jgi:hypothetical protein
MTKVNVTFRGERSDENMKKFFEQFGSDELRDYIINVQNNASTI